ncbi:MAG: ZIP family metal transporter [Planctomycetota bacterium]|jgi:zinc and cadmium transporter
MSPTGLLLIYCLLVVIASLAGGWIPMLLRLTHQRLQISLSLVSGVILGIGLLEMLPHALRERAAALALGGAERAAMADGLDAVLLWMLGGFLAMFLIERFFCFPHHDADDAGTDAAATAPDHAAGTGDHAHDHELTWSGALVGLSLHSLVAGVALAASVLGESHEHGSRWLGLGTFLVVVLHKPFDSLTLGALMAVRGHSRRRRQLVNGLFALAVPIGAGLFALGLAGDASTRLLIVSSALAFGAGAFLCIALSDLLPELQFHQHDRIKLSLALVLGLAIAWGVSRLESAGHEHDETAARTPVRANAALSPDWASDAGSECGSTLDPGRPMAILISA